MKRPARIAAIVPAAGASRRLGRDKRCLSWRGATVIEATVAALCEGGLCPVIVVLEPGSPCRELGGLRIAAVDIRTNPHPERGMLSSICVGLRAVPEGCDAAAIQPGDHPFVPVEAIRALVRRYEADRPLLLAPTYAGKRGHPLIISRPLFAEAHACDAAVGLRELVRRHEAHLALLDFEAPGADDDLDVPEDLVRLEERSRR